MLKIKKLQEALGVYEDGAGGQAAAPGMVAATSSNDIAYLPDGFTTVSKALQGLAKMKKDWDLDVVDEEDGKTVSFGNDLRIKVKKEHWSSFVKNLGGTIKSLSHKGLAESTHRTVDLSNVIREATVSEIDKNLAELERKLMTMVTERHIFGVVEDQVKWWKNIFGGSDSGYMPDSAIDVTKPRAGIKELVRRAKAVYEDDLGGLQLLINRIRHKQPLAETELFETPFKFLYGGVVKSGKLFFEAYVDYDFRFHSAVYGQRGSDFDRFVGGNKFKVVREMLVPVQGFFTLTELKTLKDDLIDQEEKDAASGREQKPVVVQKNT
jgi:hypothetical protein